jgi:hypothetical protein
VTLYAKDFTTTTKNHNALRPSTSAGGLGDPSTKIKIKMGTADLQRLFNRF